MTKRFLIASALLAWFCPAVVAEDAAFHKSKLSSLKNNKETKVDLIVSDSSLVVRDPKTKATNVSIPYSSIESMSYEFAQRHRIQEGGAVMALSLGAGAITMLTKTKSYWLAIEHLAGDSKVSTILRLDKNEYKSVIENLELKSGKHIEELALPSSTVNPTAGSEDVDEVVPFGVDKVVTALKPAMEKVGCRIKKEAAGQIECTRSRGSSERSGGGGEKITAKLNADGDRTRVRIETGKGFVGRMVKKNWSTPVYKEMMAALDPTFANK